MVNLFLWIGDLMTIYNGYIHDPIWREPCIKIVTSFNAAIDILSYKLEIYSCHVFITENHFTKKEALAKMFYNTPKLYTNKKQRGQVNPHLKTDWKYKCWAGQELQRLSMPVLATHLEESAVLGCNAHTSFFHILKGLTRRNKSSLDFRCCARWHHATLSRITQF